MDAIDWMLGPLYVFAIYFWASKKSGKSPLHKAYYLKGLRYKLGGVIAFDLIYLFYYKGGDTVNFYYAVSPTFELFFNDPYRFFEFVFTPSEYYPWECISEAKANGVGYLTKGSAALATIRVCSLLNLISLNSFIPLSVVCAFLSYLFLWQLYELFVSAYPNIHKQLAYAFLFFPSVLFWGSGIGKDSVMISCIAVIFYCFYQTFIAKKRPVRNLIILFFTSFVVSQIRGYILYSILPCLILMAVSYYQNSIKSSVLRFIIGPLFILLGAGASYLVVTSLGQSVESYKIESLEQKSEGFRSWHTTQGGSSYSLGEGDNSPTTMLKQAPLAIVIALFGPFIWQVRSIVMLLSSIEGMVLLYYSVRKILFSRKLYRIAGIITNEHILVFCIPFTIILSVAIGLTSFNYGALVRYKIQAVMFFLALIFILDEKMNS